ncbi:K02A2.6-like, partial [Cordylochernes scorpioides]
MDFVRPSELALHGNVAENWRRFKQRLMLYLEATEKATKPDKLKVAILLNFIGEEALEVFNTFHLKEDEAENFDLVINKFDDFCEPKKNVIFERFKFFSATQKDGESIDSFITELKGLSTSCEFESQKDSLIRDRIVYGIQDKALQECLLREPNLTLLKAIEMCKTDEISKQQIKIMQNNQNICQIRKYEKKHSPKQNQESEKEFKCQRCGKSHRAKNCPAWGKRCSKCKKMNHFAAFCKSSAIRSLNDETEETVWSIHEAKVVHTLEWKKSIIVNGKEICFKLDSGAEVNVLPYTFTRQMKGLEIFQTNRKLTSYTGHEIKIKGIATLNCKTKNKTESLEFFIADGYYQPILGIEAIEKLSLIKKCDAVQTEQNNSAKEILNRHKNIFEGIGRLPIEHKIRLNENTTPVIAPSRKIPFSIREKVKAELERMEKLDIIEKVEEPSEWTHPIVVVQKPSGDVRICMDPRELNKYVQRERYILPTAETIFSELKGATVFSVFDASSAFWQVPLDKESTNLCTIATPFGRFRFKRLPYGLNSASEVFQRCINNILSGLQGTACYMDDILIYGNTMEEHNRNLETVLRRLEENNVKLNAKKQQIAVDKVNLNLASVPHWFQLLSGVCRKSFLRSLEVGDNIMLQERHRKWVPATVTAKHETPRSYMVKTPSGSEYRRNRSHLRPRKFSVEDSAPTSQSPSIPGSQAGTAMDDNIQDHGRPTSENRRAYDPREDIAKKGDWPKWIRRFERFRQASGLINNPENEQVNMLVYCMGDNADDILLSCKIASDQLENYDKVIECFESHFIPRRNIIYERARFNQRCQQEGEKVNEFITALHSLAEHCNFEMLHDELIRDRIVVGVRDRALSERMQLDTDLTLVKATLMAKQLESVKEQQSSLYQQDSVDQIKKMPNHITETKRHEPKIRQFKSNQLGGSSHGCTRCGNSNNHDWKNCPAMNSYCNKCMKKGHYAKVCRSEAINEIKSEIAFLGSVEDNSKKWIVPIKVNNRQVNFKIDTGADVNVLPLQYYYQSFQRIKLEKSDKVLQGPNGIPLETVGMIHVKLQNKGQHLNSKIYIVDKLKQPFLSRETSEKLNIVRMIQQFSSNFLNPKREFPKIFNGLGHAKINYKISLQPDAKPYALCTPRRVPIPLMKQVKEQLEEMTRLGVIESVEEPTEWCAGMVAVSKPGGKIRICVDLTKLNQYIRRENYPLPATEHILGQLGNACYFSKLDANSGFWQFGLAKESQKLTTFITPFGRFFFKRIPFGITSAPEIFQRKMTQLLGNIEGVVCFMDDIVVYGSSLEEHNERVRQVLKKIQEEGMTHSTQKSVNLELKLTTIVSADASSFGIGGVLRQEQPDGSLKPIAYVSRTLSETEKRYSQIEKEGLAIVWTCERLKDYVTATEERLLEISRKQKEDSLCSQLAKYCMSGWPKNKREVDPELRGYWQFQEDLTYQNGLLLRGQRILIPKTLRKDILEKLHQGHFGINKCRSRAKESVWWLGISQEIERMVSSCTKCLKERKPKHEPLIPSEFPIRPWQKVGMDLFYLNGRWYLIVCDYYSRYPEISLLQNLTAQEVIGRLKSIFARHGTPETVRSDNGPQFQKVLGSEFSKFSKEWSFKHITSSPKFPQSNGFIEAIIKNIKQSFKKEEDCYLTLQAYRTMPLESGYSPAELLMGRRLRTSVPAIESSLMPRYLDSEALQEREKRRVINQKRLYDKRHDVHSLPPLQQGDSVWVRDQRVKGKVLHKSEEPRSYWVQTPQGKVRRNRLHLTPLPKMGSTMDASEDDQEQETEEDCPTQTASSTRDGRMQRDNQDQDPEKSLPSMPAVHTRYGRAVKIPR